MSNKNEFDILSFLEAMRYRKLARVMARLFIKIELKFFGVDKGINKQVYFYFILFNLFILKPTNSILQIQIYSKIYCEN